jgi:hypothetical protein
MTYKFKHAVVFGCHYRKLHPMIKDWYTLKDYSGHDALRY